MAKKIFVLRTNSLVAKEKAKTLLSFGNDNQICIPFPVLDELEQLTHQYSQKGKNARSILDYIDTFDIKKLMSKEGVVQPNGSTLRLVDNTKQGAITVSNLSSADRKCLEIASALKAENPKVPVILVSKNSALRLKANSIGIKAQNFRDDLFPTIKEQYKGRLDVQTSDENFNKFMEEGKLQVKSIQGSKNIEWYPNLFLQIKSLSGGSAIGRFNGKEVVKLNYTEYHPAKTQTKNVGQIMVKEALMEDAYIAPIVIIIGGAGTGKTYMALAVALEETLYAKNKSYKEILVSAPIETVGQERMGFLPGEIEDKFNPYIGGIKDNLRQLLKNMESKDSVVSFFSSGKIQIQPIGFLRGRTITDTYFIIDETQNIAPDDIKSIVTRAGKGSKFVFLGDPTQIDNPQLNERNNGLVYLSEKMKESSLVWQITLKDEESVRSDVAKLAAQIL